MNNVIDITSILKGTAALKSMSQPRISDDVDALNIELYVRRAEVTALRMCTETLLEFVTMVRDQMEEGHHYEEMHKAAKLKRHIGTVLGMVTPITEGEFSVKK